MTNNHLVLNPAYKTTYFRQRKWPEEWITTAVDILRLEWVTNYKPTAVVISDSINSSSQVCSYLKSTPGCLSTHSFSFLQVNMRNKYFSDILRPSTGSSDALELYLASPTVPIERDPLMYWDSLDPDNNTLARMATDFLSSPGESESSKLDCSI